MGDYNAELESEHGIFSLIDSRSKLIMDFMSNYDMLAINTKAVCSGAKFTNVPYNCDRETLIDFIIMSEGFSKNMVNCKILEDNALNVSTHRPVICTVVMPSAYSPQTNNSPKTDIINWKNVTQNQLNAYKCFLENSELLLQLASSDIISTREIDQLYDKIVSVINTASEACIPRVGYKPYIKPYWNRNLSELHNDMKTKRTNWMKENQPRGNTASSYKSYKDSKSKFRSAHRICVMKYMQEQEHEIDVAAEIDSCEFWKLINKRRNKPKRISSLEMVFKDVRYTDPQAINSCWRDYFADLYSPTESEGFNETYRQTVTSEISSLRQNLNNKYGNRYIIERDIVLKALNSCKKGKACGNDKIYYENVIHGGELLLSVIVKLYNCMLKSSHTPMEMKRGIIITLFKGGNKKKTDPNNYRAITLCSILLKLYEKVVLLLLNSDDKLHLNPSQGVSSVTLAV
ncbi:uncharacterized protein LOC128549265 [Mercenaria mercenaria]|uniref:uncharacterized protein LOC128549265 n=1 Tax=Mercenaria mercenaria TaxID=6596 RepID=UPI00234F2321|nr:uncharacterized protein LOC128549265 [Mercenaria mercenaria]